MTTPNPRNEPLDGTDALRLEIQDELIEHLTLERDNALAAVEEFSKYTSIVAAAEIWRHWWLRKLGEVPTRTVRELAAASEIALEHEVAKLTQ